MDLKYQNLVAVLTVLALMIGAVIVYYFTIGVGAITVGKLAEVGQSAALNLSNTSEGVLTGAETDYASNVNTASSVIPLAFGLIALVAIILIFGFKFNFAGGSGRGGVN